MKEVSAVQGNPALGDLRVYQMSFADGVWQMRREAPGFSQRYEGKVSADGQSIAGRWETSSDGTKWQHDFDITYTRASS